MDEQEIVEYFAQLAKPRLLELLRLKASHVYDPTPGKAGSKCMTEAGEVELQLSSSTQPYKDIERFLVEDKVMGYVITPGLLPIAKAISVEVRGRRLLVTRRIDSSEGGTGVVAHADELGLRVSMSFDPEANETTLLWECLFGVA
jgi:hypothetical protein